MKNNAGTAIKTRPQAKTITETAYRRIREDIVSGDLPPGMKLKIDLLRTRYDLGSGPLREALSRLSGDHLVTMEGQRGFLVAPISIADALDIGQMRKILETQALRLSVPNGDDQWEDAIVTSFHRLKRVELRNNQGIDEMSEWETYNHQFHEALVGGCQSKWLLRMRKLMFDQHERYRRFSRMKTVTSRDIHMEHKAIFDAAMDRNVEKIVQLIESHIQGTTNAVVQALTDQASQI